jgi:hypothetical protein
VALGQPYGGTIATPTFDRWMYPFNSSPGTETTAPIFAAIGQPGFDDRDGQFLVGFDTAATVPPGAGELRYIIQSARLRVVVSNDMQFAYDPTPDPVASSYDPADPAYVPDTDPGKPVELFGVGYRNGLTAATFTESTAFSTQPVIPPQEGIRSAFAAVFDAEGHATDVSRQVRQRITAGPMAVGVNANLAPGQLVPQGTELTLDIDVTDPTTHAYLSRSLNSGRLMLMVTSLQPASGGPGGGSGAYASFYTKENPVSPVLGYSASLEVHAVVYPGADFNMDGDVGTDADIEAFFASLAGAPIGNPDFDMDGDVGTDADIRAFFEALAGH